MDWHDPLDRLDEAAAALPDPVPDEPIDLRRDLVDEIGDHLQCALHRELLVDGDEERSRARVLERFGDTKSILRRLWFDHLKEKLVAQRITMVAVLVLAVASLVACGIAWNVAHGVQEANRELLKDSRETSRKLLAALAKQEAAAAEPTRTPDWNPLAVQLVGPDGDEPLKGWRVTVRGHAHTDTEETTIREGTDAQGRSDFGMVRPGPYAVEVRSPWEEELRTSVVVRPGEETVRTIRCPASAPPKAEVQLAFDIRAWERMRGKNVGLAFELVRASREVEKFQWWDLQSHYLLLQPDGRVRRLTYTGPQSRTDWLELYEPGDPHEPVLSLQAGTYALSDMQFVQLPEDGEFTEKMSVEILAPNSTLSRVPDVERQYAAMRALDGSLGEAQQTFELANDGEDETWTIAVSSDFVDQALAMLTAAELDAGAGSTEGAFRFYRADANHDGSVDEAEFDRVTGSPSPSEKASDSVTAEWPLDVRAFIEDFQVRRRFSRGRTGRAPS